MRNSIKINSAGITGVSLSRVIKLKNNGIKALQSSKDTKDELSSTEMNFMFLISPFGVETMQKWPFQIVEDHFLNEKEVWVSDCLSFADKKFLDDFSAKDCDKEKYTMSLETRVCILVHCTRSLLKKYDWLT